MIQRSGGEVEEVAEREHGGVGEDDAQGAGIGPGGEARWRGGEEAGDDQRGFRAGRGLPVRAFLRPFGGGGLHLREEQVVAGGDRLEVGRGEDGRGELHDGGKRKLADGGMRGVEVAERAEGFEDRGREREREGAEIFAGRPAEDEGFAVDGLAVGEAVDGELAPGRVLEELEERAALLLDEGEEDGRGDFPRI